ncbi:MAG: hypothetical protein ACRC8T_07805 [Acidaminococcaceae bacterium]
MAANLPFKIDDCVYDQNNKKGKVVDFRPEEVSDPSNGKFAYKVNWENGGSDWMEADNLHKKVFFERLLQKLK